MYLISYELSAYTNLPYAYRVLDKTTDIYYITSRNVL